MFQRQALRAVLCRSGTSKGLFLRRSDLPSSVQDWTPIILSAVGSPDPYGQQLDGLGGGSSTTSKVAIVGPCEDRDVADVDYTFVQVPLNADKLDFSGNCGNMSAGVGPFAVDEGFFPIDRNHQGEVTLRIRNTNTGKILLSTFMVSNGLPVEDGGLELPGVPGRGSPIRLDFLNPGGAMTGRILPSGSARDTLFIPQPQTGPSGDLVLKTLAVPVSMVDAANPFVFVHAASLGLEGNETADQLAGATPLVQLIRAHASIAMGIASTLAEAMAMQGCPKIALVAPPQSFVSSAGQSIDASRTDINSRAYSMGLPHPNLQITGAVCLAAAASIPGTIPHDIVKAARSRVPPVTTTDKHNQPEHIEDVSVLTFSKLVISHLGGTIMADSDVVRNPLLPGGVDIRSGSVYRTARRLMEGKAYYHTLSSPPVAAIMSVSASVKVPTNLLLGMDRGSYAVSAQ